MAPEATESSKGGERLSRKSNKQRTLELIKSLESDDDERTALSKKISWILRHGTHKVNVKADPDGWVKMSDLAATEILEDVSKETLMATIVDSNQQKLRYKLKEGPDGQWIKAYSKSERRKATSETNVAPNTEPATRTQGGLRQDATPFVPSAFAGAAGMPQMGFPWPMPGYGFPPMMPQWPGAYPMMPPFMMEGGASSGLPPGQYRGRIKSFNPEKGFGFIECPETHSQFHRDVFLHKAQFGDMAVGTEVTFSVETNKQGMPQAKNLAALGAGAAGGAGGKGKGGKGSKGVKGGGKEGKGGRGQGKGGRSDRSGKGAGRPSQDPLEPGAVAPKTAAPAEAATGPAAEAAKAAEASAAEAAAPAAAVTAPAAEVEASATAEAPPAAGAPAA